VREMAVCNGEVLETKRQFAMIRLPSPPEDFRIAGGIEKESNAVGKFVILIDGRAVAISQTSAPVALGFAGAFLPQPEVSVYSKGTGIWKGLLSPGAIWISAT